jgi:hypothetical protein
MHKDCKFHLVEKDVPFMNKILKMEKEVSKCSVQNYEATGLMNNIKLYL